MKTGLDVEPRACVSCGVAVDGWGPHGEHCESCAKARENACEICGDELEDPNESICGDCREELDALARHEKEEAAREAAAEQKGDEMRDEGRRRPW